MGEEKKKKKRTKKKKTKKEDDEEAKFLSSALTCAQLKERLGELGLKKSGPGQVRSGLLLGQSLGP